MLTPRTKIKPHCFKQNLWLETSWKVTHLGRYVDDNGKVNWARVFLFCLGTEARRLGLLRRWSLCPNFHFLRFGSSTLPLWSSHSKVGRGWPLNICLVLMSWCTRPRNVLTHHFITNPNQCYSLLRLSTDWGIPLGRAPWSSGKLYVLGPARALWGDGTVSLYLCIHASKSYEGGKHDFSSVCPWNCCMVVATEEDGVSGS